MTEIRELEASAKRSAAAYVVLLSLCMPLAALYLIVVDKVFAKIAGDNGTMLLVLCLLPLAAYWIAVVVLGIRNIVWAFRMGHQQRTRFCAAMMLLHKYGLVVFFCVNFVVLFGYYGIMTMAALVGTRGLVIFAAPVLLPFWVAVIGWSIFATWLAILPGTAYSLQVIYGTWRVGKLSLPKAVVHAVLQFFFLTDVLDAMYLAVKKWDMGKKSSIAVGAVYVAAVIGCVVLFLKVKAM